MTSFHIFVFAALCFLCKSSLVFAQQPYVARATTNCSNTDNSVLGYSCNGLNTTRQGHLIFRSRPPYTDVSSISTLFGSNPSQLSSINSVAEAASFDTDKMVIVPVDCSCSGDYYQANTSYTVQPDNTYFLIANDIYQGLSTCQAIQDQNNVPASNAFVGQIVNVPLRCACPTRNQDNDGINYLMSYSIREGDQFSSISTQFGVDVGLIRAANELTGSGVVIYPNTTLLIPLEDPPSSSQTVTPTPSPPPPPSQLIQPDNSSGEGSNKKVVYIAVGVVSGSVCLLVLAIIVFFVFFRKRQRDSHKIIESNSIEAQEKPVEKKKKMDEESQEFWDSLSSIGQSIKTYNFQELQAATDNFSQSFLIKGSVYRGTIKGDLAAIKKMSGDVSKEISLLDKINHTNLIRLSGVCFHDGFWYLVYEYAANGPLSEWIYHSTDDNKKHLSWTQRIQIALDVATGLNYLHTFVDPPQVHKDIRSNNILLDINFRAKIANFAFTTPLKGEKGEFTLTRHIVGTRGYMASEYLENGLVSTKLDVYAYGILLLEIITGKEIVAMYREEHTNLQDFLEVLLSKEDQGQESLRQSMDHSLQENYPTELAVLVVTLVANCVKKNPAYRPATDDILQSLSRILRASLAWEMSMNSGNYDSSIDI